MEASTLISQSGIIITLILIAIPILFAGIYLVNKALFILRLYHKKKELATFHQHLKTLSPEQLNALKKRKNELLFSLKNNELTGSKDETDPRGLIDAVAYHENPRFLSLKRKALYRPPVDPELGQLILWFIGSAVAWLVFGTSVGEYVGIKFVAPDSDHISWLSFGRLRPVHTNAVFWGWASCAMIGLGYYVVPRVSNAQRINIRMGYASLILINTSILFGTLSLMAGINNGGGEYREYTWPVMVLFAIGIILSLLNYFRCIKHRKGQEIYVSNWYILSAMMFLIVIATVAYIPNWQSGLGETIIQGYYMHQGVGMWFMLFTLGLIYYFLPQQLNKPIYSYSLGILAFWSQIVFYTLIGTHHFIFSAIPWWLQTIAIVGSAGMIIPVVAGSTNFLMTLKGSWSKIVSSYTLPFYLVGIIFYFTGSLQGTAEAFRFTNLIWHFTDFTVAHSHLTMYGIISFLLWGFIYTLVPRLTGKEPSYNLVGAHFWLALIGLLFYTFPLMYGATLRGLMWLEQKPFIDSVSLMEPYWLWRAVGGSLMWMSHLLFAYNFYVMVRKKEEVQIPQNAIEILLTKEKLETSLH
ncbi:MAG: cbb3-type cytochrome c oxidase subunit I [Bacteroidota bacterium]|nr:cbb3-type cytochrome c oxidase subunit I [Bacteroidota bacterium]MDX5429786.1 cbb3-type cytochrome c oxidase subunit I [Bacteroidota bacterium]MDX5468565.1 cbb3-type cytochrome c oxidase subunit I [Bacteroidota bacterium]